MIISPYIYPLLDKKDKLTVARTPDSIIHLKKLCADALGIPVSDMTMKGKTDAQIRAKQLFVWYARRVYGKRYTLVQIGAHCACHEHSTTMHRLRRAEDFYQINDPVFMHDYHTLNSLIDGNYQEIYPVKQKRDARKVVHLITDEVTSIKDAAIKEKMSYSSFYNSLLCKKNILPYRFI